MSRVCAWSRTDDALHTDRRLGIDRAVRHGDQSRRPAKTERLDQPSCSRSWNSLATGTVARDSQTGGTNLPHVFTGGDCANGGREVVNAVGEGKKAARGIHAILA